MFYTIGNTFATINSKLVKRFVQHNPLGLPPNTVRVRTNDGNAPIFGIYPSYATVTLVHGTSDVYDVYMSGTSFESLLCDTVNVVEVLGANTTGIRNMRRMFRGCNSLTSVPLFDTSSVTDMSSMFEGCYRLKTFQLFDTSSVTNMNNMFYQCYNVQTGALALYQQASLQATPPTYHESTFYQCGIDTQTGYEELAQIPDDWK